MITMIPQEVYIGDTAEIQYTTVLHDTSISNEKAHTVFPLHTDDYTILDAQLRVNGTSYTLIMHVVPWKTGEIDIMPIVIDGMQIDTPAITVRSIVKWAQADDIRPAQAPLLIPGSLYLLYGTIIALVMGIIMITLFFIKGRHWFAQKIHALHVFFDAKRRVKKLLRSLSALEKTSNTLDNASFFEKTAAICKAYLDRRCQFAISCVAMTSTELFNALHEFAGENRNELIYTISAVFRRCDYMRFSATDEVSIINHDERHEIIQTIIACMRQFEEAQVNEC